MHNSKYRTYWKLAEVQPGSHRDYPQMAFTWDGVASEPGGLA
jgi:hypothetical protein